MVHHTFITEHTSESTKDDCLEETIPIVQTSYSSARLKPRHLASAVSRYSSLKELAECLEKDMKPSSIRCANHSNKENEQVLALTHKLVVIEKQDGEDIECLIPINHEGVFLQTSNRSSASTFYRVIADADGIVVISFTYSMECYVSDIIINLFYIDMYTFRVSRHTETITLETRENFKFNILLDSGRICMVWPYHNYFSILNCANMSVGFKKYTFYEDLRDTSYGVKLNSDYLVITLDNINFRDSVFFEFDTLKHSIAYYSLETGDKYSCTHIKEQLKAFIHIENPVEVEFIPSLNYPTWMVTECKLPEMCTSKVYFFAVVDGEIEALGKCIDLERTFLNAGTDTSFEISNEKQTGYLLCPDNKHMFLWLSNRHILEVDLNSFQAVRIIEMQSNDFNDYKSDVYDFSMVTSLNKGGVDILVKNAKGIVHFEQFLFPVDCKQHTSMICLEKAHTLPLHFSR